MSSSEKDLSKQRYSWFFLRLQAFQSPSSLLLLGNLGTNDFQIYFPSIFDLYRSVFSRKYRALKAFCFTT